MGVGVEGQEKGELHHPVVAAFETSGGGGGGASVLNPLRSLIPRPGKGRGEGREGGSSRPQRAPPNLERWGGGVRPS